MTGMVAKCADVPGPAEGSAFGTCTSVVWVEDSAATLTTAEMQELWPAVLIFFAGIFVWRLLRKVM